MQVIPNIENGEVVSVTVTDGERTYTLKNVRDEVSGGAEILSAYFFNGILPADMQNAFHDWLRQQYDVY